MKLAPGSVDGALSMCAVLCMPVAFGAFAILQNSENVQLVFNSFKIICNMFSTM